MKERYRLIRRGSRGLKYYCVDPETGQRTSLKTRNEDEAKQLVLAKNQALRQPTLNLHIARAYLAGSDTGVSTRTWQDAMNEVVATKSGANRTRWEGAMRDKAFDLIRSKVILETRAEHLLAVLRSGTVSTNVFLRKLVNFCLDMNWLHWPPLPKRQWPPVRYATKRAITLSEHEAIVAREPNAEKRQFYKLMWHLGGSQSDIACMNAENIDWSAKTISYTRRKTGSRAQLHFGKETATLLRRLPQAGPLFPNLMHMEARHRAADFNRRCRLLKIKGVTLHSYRYAWAERARICGYPERFSQEALGHNTQYRGEE
jgi:integrase